MITNGKYSDGLVLDSQPVTLDFTAGDELRVRGENLEFTVPFTDVRISDRLGDVPRFLYLPDHATIETPDNAAIDQVLLARQQANGSRFIHFLETHSGISVGATVALILLVAYTIYFGVPALSRQVAYRVPASIDAQIGRATLAAINKSLLPSQLGVRDRQRVQEQLARLLPGTPRSKLPRLEFRSTGTLGPNAFALPGNVILVSDELVQLTGRDDEIAAVLAHELGHLEKRHGLQSILRSSTALLVVSTVTGDLSTLTSFTATLPLVLLQNGYSREFENEADHYAHDLMIARGINLKYFASILKKLEASHAGKGRGHSYLSTHPATEDRIRLFQTVETGDAEEEWQTEDAVASKKLSEEDTTAFKEFKVSTPKKPSAIKLLDTSKLDSQPEPISQERPLYPSHLRDAGIEGEVVVEFSVDDHGFAYNAFAVRSTHKEFEPSAVEAVNRWTFKPAIKNGQPVSTRMQVPVIFRLTAEPAAMETPPNSQKNPEIKIHSAEDLNASGSKNPLDSLKSKPELKDYLEKPIPDVASSSPLDFTIGNNEAKVRFTGYNVYSRIIDAEILRYPEAMRRARIEGTVVITLILTKTGEIKAPVVLNSTREEFEEAALDMVKNLKLTQFKSTTPTNDIVTRITVSFTLEKNSN